MTDDDRGVPHPPYDQLRNELGDDPAAARAFEERRAHLHGPAPVQATVTQHVDVLRAVRTIEARIANWWDDPRTQQWVKSLSDTGL
jgi:hypothetical protein